MILTSVSVALFLGVCPFAAEAQQTAKKWHPTFSVGWADGYCRYTTENNSPGYSTQLACCSSAYSGQVSGYCLSTLPAPPTTSPTTTGNLLEVWYPDYKTAWTEAGCMNNGPLPSGRPIYESQLQCCKGAYAGQVSGRCLSQLPSPPTTSPTKTGGADFYYPDYSTDWARAGCKNDLPLPFTEGGRPTYVSMLACCKGAYASQMSGACLSQLESPPTTSPTSTGGLDVYYPDYVSPWISATCINARPLPNGRPTYASMLDCCKSAYAGQFSGACLNQLESPPTTSPTMIGGVVDFWYPDYDSPYSNAGCLNTLPLPYRSGGRPTYSTHEACCAGAYAGQVSKACVCDMANPPSDCSAAVATTTTTTTQAPTLTADVDTVSPTTQSPTTQAPTTLSPTTLSPTTQAPTTQAPTTQAPTTQAPTTVSPTTSSPTTQAPTTQSLTTQAPTTQSPTTLSPTTPRHSFTSNLELKTAIQEYLSPEQGCTTNTTCKAHSDYGGAIGEWDVSKMTDFSFLFLDASSIPISGADTFNEAINWDTGSATSMEKMFYEAAAFNQPLSFDTAKVTTMRGMFNSAEAFNQPLSFDTAKVTTMQGMFHSAAAFNQPLSLDTTTYVTNMGYMFYGATAFNQDLCHFGDNWPFSFVSNMFEGSGCLDKTRPTGPAGPWCAVTNCQQFP